MNPNDILAQAQAAQQAAFNHYHDAMGFMFAIELAVFIATCWVVYMFYARLGDILDEVRRFRIAYEFEQDREANARLAFERRSTAAVSIPQTSKAADAKYMPRS
jgi:hypothetical protein